MGVAFIFLANQKHIQYDQIMGFVDIRLADMPLQVGGLGQRKCSCSLAEIAYNSLTSKLLGTKHSPLHFSFAHCQYVIHEGHSPIDF